MSPNKCLPFLPNVSCSFREDLERKMKDDKENGGLLHKVFEMYPRQR